MSQIVNGQDQDAPEKTPRTAQRVSRPGQRQQERLQRVTRRRKRRRIIASTVAAILVITAGIIGTVWFQNYNDQRIAAANAHGTATAKVVNGHATATAIVIANATATVVAKNCFVSSNAPAIPAIYTGTTPPSSGPTTAPEISGTPINGKDGLKYVDIKAGTGAVVKSGDTITANYTGWIASTCQKFDSSFDSHTDQQSGQTQPGQPFTTPIGKGQVIKGWDEGLVGMKVGGIRRLYIPAALGYGAQGGGPIPPNSNLIFDVQIVSAK